MTDETKGMIPGVIGVAIFSITLPATRIAVLGGLDAVTVGLGRAVVAAMVAAVIFVVTRQPVSPRRHWGRLVVVALGIVLGFPLFMTIAMRTVPAAHGGIVLGVLPLATTAAALLCRERPSAGFRAMAFLGSAVVVGFALIKGGGDLQAADLWLLAAAACAGVGYALSGDLSRSLGGWQVICWVLIVALPFIVPAGVVGIARRRLAGPLAGVGRVYLCRPVQPVDRLFRLEPGAGAGRCRPRRPSAVVAAVHDPGGVRLAAGGRHRLGDHHLRRWRSRRGCGARSRLFILRKCVVANGSVRSGFALANQA